MIPFLFGSNFLLISHNFHSCLNIDIFAKIIFFRKDVFFRKCLKYSSFAEFLFLSKNFFHPSSPYSLRLDNLRLKGAHNFSPALSPLTEIFRIPSRVNRRLRESRSHGLKYHRDLDWNIYLMPLMHAPLYSNVR